MKKISKMFIGVLTLGLLLFNFTMKSTVKSEGDYSLKNIRILQASAGEYNCDMKNPNCCSYPGMNSNGVLTYTF